MDTPRTEAEIKVLMAHFDEEVCHKWKNLYQETDNPYFVWRALKACLDPATRIDPLPEWIENYLLKVGETIVQRAGDADNYAPDPAEVAGIFGFATDRRGRRPKSPSALSGRPNLTEAQWKAAEAELDYAPGGPWEPKWDKTGFVERFKKPASKIAEAAGVSERKIHQWRKKEVYHRGMLRLIVERSLADKRARTEAPPPSSS